MYAVWTSIRRPFSSIKLGERERERLKKRGEGQGGNNTGLARAAYYVRAQGDIRPYFLRGAPECEGWPGVFAADGTSSPTSFPLRPLSPYWLCSDGEEDASYSAPPTLPSHAVAKADLYVLERANQFIIVHPQLIYLFEIRNRRGCEKDDVIVWQTIPLMHEMPGFQTWLAPLNSSPYPDVFCRC